MARLDTTSLNNDPNLVAYYQFEENANDQTGNFNGTATSINYAAGKYGTASVYDGANSFIAAGNPSISGDAAFSLVAWIKLNEIGSDTIVGFGDRSVGSASASLAINLSGTRGSAVELAFGGGKYAFTNNDLISSTAVYLHVAAVKSTGAFSNTVFYFNGGTVATAGADSGTPNLGSGNIRIGSFGSPSAVINGAIDEAAIFSRTLNAAEVLELYQDGTAAQVLRTSLALSGVGV